MQFNLRSILFLKKQAQNKIVNHSAEDAAPAPTKKRREKFNDWLSPKPEPIMLYKGETELFRKGLVLVTDTRLSYIDPFDLMLKTYMFEHMISLHKQFYRTSLFNRRLCKVLLVISLLVFLLILTIDLLDSDSNGFILIYIPLIASIAIGLKVWRDMKPRYALHWRMRDLTFGEIAVEPLLRERIKGDTKREVFMNELAQAMNQGLSGKAWWPDNVNRSTAPETDDNSNLINDKSEQKPNGKPELTLVTDSYQ